MTNREYIESLLDIELSGFLSTINFTNTHPLEVYEWLMSEYKEADDE